MTDLGKERKRRVVKKIWFESEKVELHLSVYLGVLPILKEYVMVFQVIKDFLEKVIKAYVACGKYMQESDITQEIIRYNADSDTGPVPRGRQHGHVVGPSYEHREIPSPEWGYQRCSFNLPWAHGGIILQPYGDIIDSKSANMNISTFDAIQTAKYYMKSRGMTATMMFKREEEKFGPVDRKLCQNMRASGGRDKAQRAERLLERRRRQVK
ncbi:hypothetical protein AAFF_G00324560 [Aldrovandia affinis]|uniref:Uncharacterized protein n=1 Tax=Aldrovandia affinis TaxID=143900 RepID=A0AAD7W076_9TELE|nr:hypothetical protein AAFF_G00324560 [Aldrovandia affinis]